jgi:hypothetical protein
MSQRRAGGKRIAKPEHKARWSNDVQSIEGRLTIALAATGAESADPTP